MSRDRAWNEATLMAEPFQTTPQNVTQHLREIYSDGELVEGATL